MLKFEYIYRHDSCAIARQVLTIEEIEQGESCKGGQWIIIARRRFTGFKDKVGREIYEGDYINYAFVDNIGLCEIRYDEEKSLLGMVDLAENSNRVYSLNAEDIADRSFVVGNIYEDPELANGVKTDA